jgi:hypothetical protein
MFGIKTPLDNVSKKVGGIVSNARSMLEFNPQLSAMILPPQVSMGLKLASTIGGQLGVKIPSEKELLNLAQGKVDNILGGIREPILKQLNAVESEVKRIEDKLKGLSPEEAIKSIDWLK